MKIAQNILTYQQTYVKPLILLFSIYWIRILMSVYNMFGCNTEPVCFESHLFVARLFVTHFFVPNTLVSQVFVIGYGMLLKLCYFQAEKK